MAKAKTATAEDLDDAEGGAAEGAAAGGGKKLFGLIPIPSFKMLLIGGGVLGLLLIGGGTYFMFFRHSAEDEAAKVAQVPGKAVVFVDLPEVLVNLSNSNSERTQYLKVKVVLELSDQKMIEQIQPIMPRIMDAFQTYLRELRPTDLDGSAGLYRLKEELTRRVNASIAPSRINAVLFKEIVVQ
jgi:flagellar FliL protein